MFVVLNYARIYVDSTPNSSIAFHYLSVKGKQTFSDYYPLCHALIFFA